MMSNTVAASPSEIAIQALRLPHPNRSGELVLRVGVDKVGNHVLFEAHKDCKCPDRWSYYRKATPAESVAIDGIDFSELEAARGPAGMKVYFHRSEMQ